MEGSATLTIVKSSTTMNCAIASVMRRAVPGAVGASAPSVLPGTEDVGRLIDGGRYAG
jgi:hypothetical protein